MTAGSSAIQSPKKLGLIGMDSWRIDAKDWYTRNNKHADSLKMKSLMKMITIFLLISIFLSSCEKEKYFYSDKLELGASLFNLSTNEIKAISCRINSESIDSFFSPPVLEPSYKLVGIIYLEDTYKLLNAGQSEKKNMMVQYPSNNTIRDWSTSTKWSDELIKDGVRGEVYYSHSQHAFYFEVYK